MQECLVDIFELKEKMLRSGISCPGSGRVIQLRVLGRCKHPSGFRKLWNFTPFRYCRVLLVKATYLSMMGNNIESPNPSVFHS